MSRATRTMCAIEPLAETSPIVIITADTIKITYVVHNMDYKGGFLTVIYRVTSRKPSMLAAPPAIGFGRLDLIFHPTPLTPTGTHRNLVGLILLGLFRRFSSDFSLVVSNSFTFDFLEGRVVLIPYLQLLRSCRHG